MTNIVSGNVKSTERDIRGRAARLGLRLDDHKVYVLWKDRPLGGAWLYEIHMTDPEPEVGVNYWLRDTTIPSGLWISERGMVVNAVAKSEEERRRAYEVYLVIQRHQPGSFLFESAVEEELVRPIEYETHEFKARNQESDDDAVTSALVLAVKETEAWAARHRRNRTGIRHTATRLAELWSEKTGVPADEAAIVNYQEELAKLDAVRLVDEPPNNIWICKERHLTDFIVRCRMSSRALSETSPTSMARSCPGRLAREWRCRFEH